MIAVSVVCLVPGGRLTDEQPVQTSSTMTGITIGENYFNNNTMYMHITQYCTLKLLQCSSQDF